MQNHNPVSYVNSNVPEWDFVGEVASLRRGFG